LQDPVGVPLFLNTTLTQPTIASIEALEGLAVTLVDNHIEIGLSGTPVTTKTVLVNELSDLPTAIGGKIFGADNTDYFLTNDITNPDEFICGDSSVFRAVDSSVVTYTYTGSGTAFDCTDGSSKLTKFKLAAPNGEAFNAKSTTGQDLFQMIDMTVSECDTAGTIETMGAVQISDVSWEDIKTDGIGFIGTTGVMIVQNNLIVQNAGDFLNLGTAVFSGFNFLNSFSFLAAGTTLLKGAASSANIADGSLGVMTNVRVSGAGDPLSGITSDDTLWNFLLNDEVRDTRTDAMMSLSGNATETTITTINTPVKVDTGDTWVEEGASQFTVDSTGKATYTGGKDVRLPVTIPITAAMASGGTNAVTFYLALNGSVIANSGAANDISTISGRTTIAWQVTLSTDDFLELWAENNDGTVNIIVTDATLRIN
jgi:hypothetical protein